MITGIDGFIGRNLRVRLREQGYSNIIGITETSTQKDLEQAAAQADFIFHLAGINRPSDPAEFVSGNAVFTKSLCTFLTTLNRPTPIVFSSSTQALLDNPYGASKRAAEETLLRYSMESGAPVYIFRHTNVFGKWSRPNYNSVVATFCHNLTHGLPLVIHDPSSVLRLVYIDDVINTYLKLLSPPPQEGGILQAGPVFETTVGEVADILQSFANSRTSLFTGPVGNGLHRALYATYLSHLSPEAFFYDVPRYADSRGEFTEMLKTSDCGQFSYFTAPPGVTRGEHYHHTKSEKFLIIRGTARFQFRHIDTQERFDVIVPGGEGRIVETVPGWAHNITSIGNDELIVMLWANEVFDRSRPDTIAMQVEP